MSIQNNDQSFKNKYEVKRNNMASQPHQLPGPSRVRNASDSNGSSPDIEVNISFLEMDVPRLRDVLELNRLMLIPKQEWIEQPAVDGNLLEVQRKTFEEKIAKLTADLQQCESNLQTANQKNSVAEIEITHLQQSLEESHKREEKLQLDIANQDGFYEDLHQQLEKETQSANKKCTEIEKKYEEAVATVADLESQLKQTGDQLATEKVVKAGLAKIKEEAEEKLRDERIKRTNDAIRMKNEKERLTQEKFRFLAFLLKLKGCSSFSEEIDIEHISSSMLDRICEHVGNLIQAANDDREELERNREIMRQISNLTGTRLNANFATPETPQRSTPMTTTISSGTGSVASATPPTQLSGENTEPPKENTTSVEPQIGNNVPMPIPSVSPISTETTSPPQLPSTSLGSVMDTPPFTPDELATSKRRKTNTESTPCRPSEAIRRPTRIANLPTSDTGIQEDLVTPNTETQMEADPISSPDPVPTIVNTFSVAPVVPSSSRSQAQANNSTNYPNNPHGSHIRSSQTKCSCGKVYQNKKGLTTHIKRMTGPWNYKCTACNKEFYFRYELGRHHLSSFNCRNNVDAPTSTASNTQQGGGCHSTGNSSNNESALPPNESTGNPQQQQHDQVEPSTSSRRNPPRPSTARQAAIKKQAEMRKLQQEILKRKKHAPWVSRRGKGTVQGNWYCQCFQKFASKTNLHFHIHYMTSDWKFPCEYEDCEEKYFCLSYLKKHLKKAHKIKNPLSEYSAGCYMCGEKFHKRSDFYRHRKIVHNIGGPGRRAARLRPSIIIPTRPTQSQPSGTTASAGITIPPQVDNTMEVDELELILPQSSDDAIPPAAEPSGVRPVIVVPLKSSQSESLDIMITPTPVIVVPPPPVVKIDDSDEESDSDTVILSRRPRREAVNTVRNTRHNRERTQSFSSPFQPPLSALKKEDPDMESDTDTVIF